jgi:phosphoglycolate phosphatase-like HAD superfamily hydrolase
MLLLWDIDGTLLTTARAGIHAWEDALDQVTGVCADLAGFDTAGYLDHMIARRLLEDVAGVAVTDSIIERLVRRYEDHLPEALGRRQGRVLPNVREILECVSRLPSFRSMLLTGNTRRGAAAKLAHYGLDRFFEDGAFSDAACEREAIARVALDRARASGWLAPGGAVVIGDTPHDVRCGRAVGVRTLAVATGGYGVEELARHEPWLVLPELPPVEEFLRLLRGVEVPSDV